METQRPQSAIISHQKSQEEVDHDYGAVSQKEWSGQDDREASQKPSGHENRRQPSVIETIELSDKVGQGPIEGMESSGPKETKGELRTTKFETTGSETEPAASTKTGSFVPSENQHQTATAPKSPEKRDEKDFETKASPEVPPGDQDVIGPHFTNVETLGTGEPQKSSRTPTPLPDSLKGSKTPPVYDVDIEGPDQETEMHPQTKSVVDSRFQINDQTVISEVPDDDEALEGEKTLEGWVENGRTQTGSEIETEDDQLTESEQFDDDEVDDDDVAFDDDDDVDDEPEHGISQDNQATQDGEGSTDENLTGQVPSSGKKTLVPIARRHEETLHTIPEQGHEQPRDSSAIEHNFGSQDALSADLTNQSDVSFDERNIVQSQNYGSMSRADKEEGKIRERWVPSIQASESTECECSNPDCEAQNFDAEEQTAGKQSTQKLTGPAMLTEVLSSQGGSQLTKSDFASEQQEVSECGECDDTNCRYLRQTDPDIEQSNEQYEVEQSEKEQSHTDSKLSEQGDQSDAERSKISAEQSRFMPLIEHESPVSAKQDQDTFSAERDVGNNFKMTGDNLEAVSLSVAPTTDDPTGSLAYQTAISSIKSKSTIPDRDYRTANEILSQSEQDSRPPTALSESKSSANQAASSTRQIEPEEAEELKRTIAEESKKDGSTIAADSQNVAGENLKDTVETPLEISLRHQTDYHLVADPAEPKLSSAINFDFQSTVGTESKMPSTVHKIESAPIKPAVVDDQIENSQKIFKESEDEFKGKNFSQKQADRSEYEKTYRTSQPRLYAEPEKEGSTAVKSVTVTPFTSSQQRPESGPTVERDRTFPTKEESASKTGALERISHEFQLPGKRLTDQTRASGTRPRSKYQTNEQEQEEDNVSAEISEYQAKTPATVGEIENSQGTETKTAARPSKISDTEMLSQKRSTLRPSPRDLVESKATTVRGTMPRSQQQTVEQEEEDRFSNESQGDEKTMSKKSVREATSQKTSTMRPSSKDVVATKATSVRGTLPKSEQQSFDQEDENKNSAGRSQEEKIPTGLSREEILSQKTSTMRPSSKDVVASKATTVRDTPPKSEQQSFDQEEKDKISAGRLQEKKIPTRLTREEKLSQKTSTMRPSSKDVVATKATTVRRTMPRNQQQTVSQEEDDGFLNDRQRDEKTMSKKSGREKFSQKTSTMRPWSKDEVATKATTVRGTLPKSEQQSFDQEDEEKISAGRSQEEVIPTGLSREEMLSQKTSTMRPSSKDVVATKATTVRGTLPESQEQTVQQEEDDGFLNDSQKYDKTMSRKSGREKFPQKISTKSFSSKDVVATKATTVRGTLPKSEQKSFDQEDEDKISAGRALEERIPTGLSREEMLSQKTSTMRPSSKDVVATKATTLRRTLPESQEQTVQQEEDDGFLNDSEGDKKTMSKESGREKFPQNTSTMRPSSKEVVATKATTVRGTVPKSEQQGFDQEDEDKISAGRSQEELIPTGLLREELLSQKTSTMRPSSNDVVATKATTVIRTLPENQEQTVQQEEYDGFLNGSQKDEKTMSRKSGGEKFSRKISTMSPSSKDVVATKATTVRGTLPKSEQQSFNQEDEDKISAGRAQEERLPTGLSRKEMLSQKTSTMRPSSKDAVATKATTLRGTLPESQEQIIQQEDDDGFLNDSQRDEKKISKESGRENFSQKTSTMRPSSKEVVATKATTVIGTLPKSEQQSFDQEDEDTISAGRSQEEVIPTGLSREEMLSQKTSTMRPSSKDVVATKATTIRGTLPEIQEQTVQQEENDGFSNDSQRDEKTMSKKSGREGLSHTMSTMRPSSRDVVATKATTLRGTLPQIEQQKIDQEAEDKISASKPQEDKNPIGLSRAEVLSQKTSTMRPTSKDVVATKATTVSGTRPRSQQQTLEQKEDDGFSNDSQRDEKTMSKKSGREGLSHKTSTMRPSSKGVVATNATTFRGTLPKSEQQSTDQDAEDKILASRSQEEKIPIDLSRGEMLSQKTSTMRPSSKDVVATKATTVSGTMQRSQQQTLEHKEGDCFSNDSQKDEKTMSEKSRREGLSHKTSTMRTSSKDVVATKATTVRRTLPRSEQKIIERKEEDKIAAGRPQEEKIPTGLSRKEKLSQKISTMRPSSKDVAATKASTVRGTKPRSQQQTLEREEDDGFSNDSQRNEKAMSKKSGREGLSHKTSTMRPSSKDVVATRATNLRRTLPQSGQQGFDQEDEDKISADRSQEEVIPTGLSREEMLSQKTSTMRPSSKDVVATKATTVRGTLPESQEKTVQQEEDDGSLNDSQRDEKTISKKSERERLSQKTSTMRPSSKDVVATRAITLRGTLPKSEQQSFDQEDEDKISAGRAQEERIPTGLSREEMLSQKTSTMRPSSKDVVRTKATTVKGTMLGSQQQTLEQEEDDGFSNDSQRDEKTMSKKSGREGLSQKTSTMRPSSKDVVATRATTLRGTLPQSEQQTLDQEKEYKISAGRAQGEKIPTGLSRKKMLSQKTTTMRPSSKDVVATKETTVRGTLPENQEQTVQQEEDDGFLNDRQRDEKTMSKNSGREGFSQKTSTMRPSSKDVVATRATTLRGTLPKSEQQSTEQEEGDKISATRAQDDRIPTELSRDEMLSQKTYTMRPYSKDVVATKATTVRRTLPKSQEETVEQEEDEGFSQNSQRDAKTTSKKSGREGFSQKTSTMRPSSKDVVATKATTVRRTLPRNEQQSVGLEEEDDKISAGRSQEEKIPTRLSTEEKLSQKTSTMRPSSKDVVATKATTVRKTMPRSREHTVEQEEDDGFSDDSQEDDKTMSKKSGKEGFSQKTATMRPSSKDVVATKATTVRGTLPQIEQQTTDQEEEDKISAGRSQEEKIPTRLSTEEKLSQKTSTMRPSSKDVVATKATTVRKTMPRSQEQTVEQEEEDRFSNDSQRDDKTMSKKSGREGFSQKTPTMRPSSKDVVPTKATTVRGTLPQSEQQTTEQEEEDKISAGRSQEEKIPTRLSTEEKLSQKTSTMRPSSKDVVATKATTVRKTMPRSREQTVEQEEEDRFSNDSQRDDKTMSKKSGREGFSQKKPTMRPSSKDVVPTKAPTVRRTLPQSEQQTTDQEEEDKISAGRSQEEKIPTRLSTEEKLSQKTSTMRPSSKDVVATKATTVRKTMPRSREQTVEQEEDDGFSDDSQRDDKTMSKQSGREGFSQKTTTMRPSSRDVVATKATTFRGTLPKSELQSVDQEEADQILAGRSQEEKIPTRLSTEEKLSQKTSTMRPSSKDVVATKATTVKKTMPRSQEQTVEQEEEDCFSNDSQRDDKTMSKKSGREGFSQKTTTMRPSSKDVVATKATTVRRTLPQSEQQTTDQDAEDKISASRSQEEKIPTRLSTEEKLSQKTSKMRPSSKDVVATKATTVRKTMPRSREQTVEQEEDDGFSDDSQRDDKTMSKKSGREGFSQKTSTMRPSSRDVVATKATIFRGTLPESELQSVDQEEADQILAGRSQEEKIPTRLSTEEKLSQKTSTMRPSSKDVVATKATTVRKTMPRSQEQTVEQEEEDRFSNDSQRDDKTMSKKSGREGFSQKKPTMRPSSKDVVPTKATTVRRTLPQSEQQTTDQEEEDKISTGRTQEEKIPTRLSTEEKLSQKTSTMRPSSKDVVATKATTVRKTMPRSQEQTVEQEEEDRFSNDSQRDDKTMSKKSGREGFSQKKPTMRPSSKDVVPTKATTVRRTLPQSEQQTTDQEEEDKISTGRTQEEKIPTRLSTEEKLSQKTSTMRPSSKDVVATNATTVRGTMPRSREQTVEQEEDDGFSDDSQRDEKTMSKKSGREGLSQKTSTMRPSSRDVVATRATNLRGTLPKSEQQSTDQDAEDKISASRSQEEKIPTRLSTEEKLSQKTSTMRPSSKDVVATKATTVRGTMPQSREQTVEQEEDDGFSGDSQRDEKTMSKKSGREGFSQKTSTMRPSSRDVVATEETRETVPEAQQHSLEEEDDETEFESQRTSNNRDDGGASNAKQRAVKRISKYKDESVLNSIDEGSSIKQKPSTGISHPFHSEASTLPSKASKHQPRPQTNERKTPAEQIPPTQTEKITEATYDDELSDKKSKTFPGSSHGTSDHFYDSPFEKGKSSAKESKTFGSSQQQMEPKIDDGIKTEHSYDAESDLRTKEQKSKTSKTDEQNSKIIIDDQTSKAGTESEYDVSRVDLSMNQTHPGESTMESGVDVPESLPMHSHQPSGYSRPFVKSGTSYRSKSPVSERSGASSRSKSRSPTRSKSRGASRTGSRLSALSAQSGTQSSLAASSRVEPRHYSEQSLSADTGMSGTSSKASTAQKQVGYVSASPSVSKIDHASSLEHGTPPEVSASISREDDDTYRNRLPKSNQSQSYKGREKSGLGSDLDRENSDLGSSLKDGSKSQTYSSKSGKWSKNNKSQKQDITKSKQSSESSEYDRYVKGKKTQK